jgi:hypothetical protein
MKQFARILTAICAVSFWLPAQEMLRIPSFDGVEIVGRLAFPDAHFSNKLIIDVPGTGPNTYENFRRLPNGRSFRYNGMIADAFRSRGMAYFSFNTRYTTSDTAHPPYFDRVDSSKFSAYSDLKSTRLNSSHQCG